jgi:hypothetical protein
MDKATFERSAQAMGAGSEQASIGDGGYKLLRSDDTRIAMVTALIKGNYVQLSASSVGPKDSNGFPVPTATELDKLVVLANTLSARLP